jgi:hypothetical protein
MHIIPRTCAGAFAALMALPVLAAPGETALASPVLAGQPSPSAPPAAASASADVLDAARGGSDAIASDTRVQGGVNGNSATNVSTGANVIQTGSFANAAGIVAVVQNTGTNVLIQHTAVVNVQFK